MVHGSLVAEVDSLSMSSSPRELLAATLHVADACKEGCMELRYDYA